MFHWKSSEPIAFVMSASCTITLMTKEGRVDTTITTVRNKTKQNKKTNIWMSQHGVDSCSVMMTTMTTMMMMLMTMMMMTIIIIIIMIIIIIIILMVY